MKFKIVQTDLSGDKKGIQWSWWTQNSDAVARLQDQPAVYGIDCIEEWDKEKKVRTWLPGEGWRMA